jgi:hypothetical protein
MEDDATRPPDDWTELIEELTSDAPEAAQQLSDFATSLANRRDATLAALEVRSARPVPSLGPAPELLHAHLQGLSGHLAALTGADALNQRSRLQLRREVLEDQRWGYANRSILSAEARRLARQSALDELARSIDTRPVSLLSRRVGELCVTEELGARFKVELEALRVSWAPVHVTVDRSEQGEFYYRIAFEEVGSTRVQAVLSDGEQRAVALAMFLAERGDDASGIVLDDPVSSLDAEWRVSVAQRLSRLAAHRQVVVLTHDIIFYMALQKEAQRVGTAFHPRVIRRETGRVGVTANEEPEEGQSTAQRVEAIKRRLDRILDLVAARDAAETDEDVAARADGIRQLCRDAPNDFRLAWERAAEEVLLADVVRRYSRDVILSRLPKVRVTECAVQELLQAFGWWSQYLHTEGHGAQAPEPTLEALQTELRRLEQWLAEYR